MYHLRYKEQSGIVSIKNILYAELQEDGSIFADID